MRRLNVAMIGHRFMGKAHSNAWRQVARFFKTPFEPFGRYPFGLPVFLSPLVEHHRGLFERLPQLGLQRSRFFQGVLKLRHAVLQASLLCLRFRESSLQFFLLSSLLRDLAALQLRQTLAVEARLGIAPRP